MISLWTVRDLDIVETLTRRVRLLSLDQIARIWWPRVGSLRVIRRRLRRLAASGLIHRTIANVHRPLDVSRPLAQWKPGVDEPDSRQISLQAKNRWQSASTPHELFFATKLAANLYGSSAGALPEFNHRDHDLLLGQVYAVYRTTSPEDARWWVGRDTLPKASYRIKNPDAFLVDSHGEVTRIIESAGRCDSRQVEGFHDHCVQCGLPYELW